MTGAATAAAVTSPASTWSVRPCTAASQRRSTPPDGRWAPRVVVGLPQGSRHELGVLAFAASARRCGLDVTYLGADLPVAAWADADVISTASAVLLEVPTAEDADLDAATVSALVERRPGTRVFTGGAAQDLLAPAVRPLGHRVGVGARRLAAVLRRFVAAVSA